MKKHKTNIAFFMDGGEGGGVSEYNRLLSSNIDRDQFYTIGIFIGKGKCYDSLNMLFDKSVILSWGRLVNYKPDSNKYLTLIEKSIIAFYSFIYLIILILRYNIKIIDVSYYPHHIIAGFAAQITGIKCIWHWHGASTFRNLKYKILSMSGELFASKIVAISNFVKLSLPENLIAKTDIIYNGVEIEDHEDFNLFTHLGISEKYTLIAMIGTLIPLKGHTHFINTAHEMLMINPNMKFLIIGEETEIHQKKFKYKETLNDLILYLNRENDILFTGNIPNISMYLKSLSCVIMPTRPYKDVMGEGFGLVAVEAMAKGVPVIATNTGAFEEIISHGKDGFLVRPDDIENTVKYIEFILKKENSAYISQNAKNKVKQKFTIQRMVNQLESLYQMYC
ncbi:glycosyltransferase family 4 protein [Oceanihabitans sediminis]|uniref:glycosyltransferase family 4 protein n=1 Tax=Oceanihabitans sediminis TaxID=1812012 RepID=UPI00299EC363|nr:glycosyltransferase family 4 protein [Oceanihabitans sediminis]MDX1774865.1 glycosyltransferase family 4 protein [Oceanihabitans sediminis]